MLCLFFGKIIQLFEKLSQINALINKRNLDYLLYEGGTYSSEWVWSKVLHIINTNVAIKDAAYAWVEHWIG